MNIVLLIISNLQNHSQLLVRLTFEDILEHYQEWIWVDKDLCNFHTLVHSQFWNLHFDPCWCKYISFLPQQLHYKYLLEGVQRLQLLEQLSSHFLLKLQTIQVFEHLGRKRDLENYFWTMSHHKLLIKWNFCWGRKNIL